MADSLKSKKPETFNAFGNFDAYGIMNNVLLQYLQLPLLILLEH
jgi:hypothetical protein